MVQYLSEKGQPDAWCFGKTMKGYEIYVKLTIEEKKKRKNAICISFHESTKPLSYPIDKPAIYYCLFSWDEALMSDTSLVKDCDNFISQDDQV